VLAHIAICLVSTPASLGDPKKDTQEELEERHERIVTASLSAAAALLTMMQQAAQQQGPPDQPGSSNSSGADSAAAAAAAAAQEVQAKVSEMLTAPGFFKQKLGSKSAVVQRAAYGFIQAVCSADPQLLKPYLATAAPAVMAALQVGRGQGTTPSFPRAGGRCSPSRHAHPAFVAFLAGGCMVVIRCKREADWMPVSSAFLNTVRLLLNADALLGRQAVGAFVGVYAYVMPLPATSPVTASF
jgi:hypothetical protein